MTRLHVMPTCAREEWNRAYHGARIGIQHPPMVRPAGVPRRTWRLAVAAVLWRARRNRDTVWQMAQQQIKRWGRCD